MKELEDEERCHDRVDAFAARERYTGGMPPVRQRLGSLGLLLASFAMILAASELAARLTWRDTGAARSVDPAAASAHADLPHLRTVSEAMRPGARGLFRDVLFETNRHGFRGPDVPVPKPRGSFRIVLIGDSVTMGGGVLREDTYAARTERALAGTHGALHIEVLNLGYAGLDAWGSLKRLHDVGLALEPDLIVYGFTLNDIQGPYYRRTRDDGIEQLARARADRSPSYTWRLLRPRLASLRELFDPPADSYVHELDENYFGNPDAFAHLVSALGTLARISADQGVCALVLIHTKLYYLHWLHPFRRHYDAIEQSARSYGLSVVQSLPYFMGEFGSELWQNPHNPHPNAEGHRILAQALVAGLGELPEVCWQH
jgi:lysophospholipase L1-like esterase